jgi:hypothetical protein
VTARLYLLPIESVNVGGLRMGPAFLPWSFEPDPLDNIPFDRAAGDDWQLYTYGSFDWCLCAVEIPTGIHPLLAAKAGVRQIPEDLDSLVGGARDTVRGYLEEMALPGAWVVNSTPWREVVRTVCGVFTLGQRYDALTPAGEQTFGQRLVGNLNVQWQNIPQEVRDRVVTAGSDLTPPLDFSEVTPTTTVRNVLKLLADQWQGQTVAFGSIMTV